MRGATAKAAHIPCLRVRRPVRTGRLPDPAGSQVRARSMARPACYSPCSNWWCSSFQTVAQPGKVVMRKSKPRHKALKTHERRGGEEEVG